MDCAGVWRGGSLPTYIKLFQTLIRDSPFGCLLYLCAVTHLHILNWGAHARRHREFGIGGWNRSRELDFCFSPFFRFLR